MVVISNVKDKDVLWCMSSDLFPFSPTLMEAYSTIDLDGPALALSEVFSNLPIKRCFEFRTFRFATIIVCVYTTTTKKIHH